MNYLRNSLYSLTRFNKKYYLLTVVLIEILIKINGNFHWLGETQIFSLECFRFSLLISLALKISLINMILNPITGVLCGCGLILARIIDFIVYIKGIFYGVKSVFALIIKKCCEKKIPSPNCECETASIKKSPVNNKLNNNIKNDLVK